MILSLCRPVCPDCRDLSSFPPVSASTQTTSSITGSTLSLMAPTSALVRIAGLSGALAIGMQHSHYLDLVTFAQNCRPGNVGNSLTLPGLDNVCLNF